MISRTDVVAKAREYLDTPFHHQARLKGVGIDCVGLVICVCKDLNILSPEYDVTGYPRIPDGTSFLYHAEEVLITIPSESMQIGDAVVVSYDRDPQHIGILGDYRHGGFSIIHASSEANKVIETRLMFSEYMKFVGAYALPGVE